MLRKLVMYLSAFLPMFLIMWIKEILLGIRNVLDKPWKYSWKSIYLNPYLIGEIIVILLIGLVLHCLLKRNQRTSVYTITLKTVKNRSVEYYLALKMKWHLILLTWIGLVKIIWTLIEICLIPLFHFWMSIDFRGTKSLFIATRGNRGLQQLAYYILHAWGHSNMPISIPLFKN